MADLDIAALRERTLLTHAEIHALLDAAEQLQAVKAERNELRGLLAIVNRDGGQGSVAQAKDAYYELRAQRDALLADTDGYLEVFRRTDMQRMVSDEMKNPELAAQRQRLQDNVRNCKETNQ